MTTHVHKKMINFWLKIKFSPEEKFSSVLCQFLSNLSSEAPEPHNFKWCEIIKNILNHTGFSDAWYAQNMDLEYFKTIFAQRSNDIFMQKWFEDVSGNSQCSPYKLFKESLKMEEYLTLLDTADKYIITKFRTRTHHIPVTNRRFHRSDENITCPLCPTGEVGDEPHYLFKCAFFEKDRKKLIPQSLLELPNDIAIHNLFDSGKESLIKTAKFAKIIISKFKFNKFNKIQSPVKKKIVTRSGRIIKPPSRLCIWICVIVLLYLLIFAVKCTNV